MSWLVVGIPSPVSCKCAIYRPPRRWLPGGDLLALPQAGRQAGPLLAYLSMAVDPGPAEAKQVVAHAAAAWEWFRGIGAPKLHVAPMVDQVGVHRLYQDSHACIIMRVL